jgi:hypothetical protein
VKPVNFNQLLLHPRAVTLSFFISPRQRLDHPQLETFLDDMFKQLQLQNQHELASILEAVRLRIKTIVASHPRQSHAFFLSQHLQGYMIIEQELDTYCIFGTTFHVRPLLEEFFINPELMVINISPSDIKVFRGNLSWLELVQQHEFAQEVIGPEMQSRVYAPQIKGLLPHKIQMVVKSIASKINDSINYEGIPVIISGPEHMRELLLKYFKSGLGAILEVQHDLGEKTCVELVESCRPYRMHVMDFHSQQLVNKIKRMIKSKLLVSDLGLILKKAIVGEVAQLVLPTKIRVYGTIDLIHGHYEIHQDGQETAQSVDILNELAEEVLRQGGKIKILGNHFFPAGASLLAVLKG